MRLSGLSKNIWRVIFGKEEMIYGGSNFNTKPFCELLILDTQVLDSVLDLNFLEEIRQTISFNNVLSKSMKISSC